MTPWTVARRAPLSMEFSRQEYWSGLPFPSPEERCCSSEQRNQLPNQGIEPGSSVLQVDSLPSESPGKPLETTEGVKCQFLPPSFVTRVKWACVYGIALWAIEHYADPVILICQVVLLLFFLLSPLCLPSWSPFLSQLLGCHLFPLTKMSLSTSFPDPSMF